ncbi:MAG TPA: hypothetical protein VGM76_04310 [Lacipirellulaceae bacterium]|jgi:dienelactone hydrolase
MLRRVRVFVPLLILACGTQANGQLAEQVVDIGTRPGVTQRMVVIAPQNPKAVVILLAGGHGGLQIAANGVFQWGAKNFLVRTRQMFAEQGLFVIVVDAPSDRQSPPYLTGFRNSPQHVADIRAVIAWARKQANVPVWLVGTSRGTESAAFAATQLAGADGPDGLVLTSTILTDNKEVPVTAMPLGNLQIPVLVVQHVQDSCKHCPYAEAPRLMQELVHVPKKQLLPINGGVSQGDPCEAMAYHGFNGVEREVVTQIAAWMLTK